EIMQISLEKRPVEAIESEALVLFLWEGQKHEGVQQVYPELFESGEFSGKALQLTLLHHPAGFAAKRLLLVGLGKQEQVSAANWREAAGAAIRFLRSRSIREAAFSVDSAASAEAVTEGAILGDYEPDVYKSDNKEAK